MLANITVVDTPEPVNTALPEGLADEAEVQDVQEQPQK